MYCVLVTGHEPLSNAQDDHVVKKEPKKTKSGIKVKKASKRSKASFKRHNKAKPNKKDTEEEDDGKAHRLGNLSRSFAFFCHPPSKHMTSRYCRGFPYLCLSLAFTRATCPITGLRRPHTATTAWQAFPRMHCPRKTGRTKASTATVSTKPVRS